MRESTTTPAVSVVIPAFNAERTLGGTLTGALTQTYPRIEVVVVDDGSTDHTADIAKAHGAPVRVVRQPNRGPSAARNAGVAAARGDLLVFCDADDVLLPPAVAAMVQRWQQAGAGRRMVTCNAYPLTAEGINPLRSRALLSYPDVRHQRMAILRQNYLLTVVLMPRELFVELGGFDTALAAAEDWDLWLRAVYSGVEVLFQKRPHALWRWRSGSLSANRNAMLEGEEEVFRRFAAATAGRLSPPEQAYLRRRLVNGSPWRIRAQADDALRRGDLAHARREYRRAAGHFPRDRRLQLRAWSMWLFPPSARAWRSRQLGIEAAMARTGAGQADLSPSAGQGKDASW